MRVLETLRQGVGTVLYPVQRTLLVPRDFFSLGSQYTTDVAKLRSENAELRQIEASNARALLQNEQLSSENAQLRRLLEMRDQVRIKSTVAEVLYETRDSFTRKVVINRGLLNEVYPGQPVIDARGVIGQVVRVTQYSAEVQLVTDPNALLPVEVQRSGQRAVAYGGPGPGAMELRFLASNSDIKDGDLIVTSGLDRIYPAGLPVGKVKRFDRNASSSFSSALVEPMTAVERCLSDRPCRRRQKSPSLNPSVGPSHDYPRISPSSCESCVHRFHAGERLYLEYVSLGTLDRCA
jgi:rod shape-determining protein MreC